MSPFAPVNDNLAPGSARDRRQTPRSQVLLQGKLISLAGDFSADCAIRDFSLTGARIQINPEAVAAAPFLVVVRQGVVYESRTIWREDGEVGLAFTDRVALGGETTPRMRTAQRIWAQLAPR